MEDKIELGLKILWTDRETAFREIVDENRDIRILRDHLMSKKTRTQRDEVHLGEMVRNVTG